MDAVQWPPAGPLPLAVADLAPLEGALAGVGAVAPGGSVTGLPRQAALVVGTSGTTGPAKLAVLTADALRASASATHEHLGGPGQWLLALPATHVAGLQVLARSLLAGYAPLAAEDTGPRAFAAAVGRLTGPRRYTSLVPTQLVRLLDDEEALDAARSLDAILVGGAALAPAVRRRAVDEGLAIVRTYGMSETAGGCVYDGRPLSCTQIRVENDIVHLGGPMVALGYHGRRSDDFCVRDGIRWFRTSDLGSLRDGILAVHGRADDVIVTGGLKVSPHVVEQALLDDPDVVEACVVGLPDDEWGQVVAAAVVTRSGGRPSPDLPSHARPKVLHVVEQALPRRGPGKPDRAAVRELLLRR